MANIGNFFNNVMSEMRKVSWPRRRELTKYTIVVISTVIFMALYFAVIDAGISELFRWFIAL